MKKLLLLLPLSLMLVGCNEDQTAEFEKQIEELEEENQSLKVQLAEATAAVEELSVEEVEEDVATETEETETVDYLNFGERYTVDSFAEFQLDGYEFTNEILPPDTSGAYGYYELSNENNSYLLLKGSIKNLHNETIYLDSYSESFTGTVVYDGSYTYDNVRFASPSPGDSDPYKDSLDPLEEALLYVYVEVPKEVSENAGAVDMEIGVNGEVFNVKLGE